MPLHFVYVLTTDQSELYPTYAYIAASSVRRLHPDARITLLTDPASREILERSQRRLVELVDQVECVDVDEPELRKRSRHLKTTTRRYVEGDYVFMDVDTLVLRPLDGIFDGVASLAAAADRNAVHPYPHFPEWHVPLFERLGWDHPRDRYFSSGLIAARDVPDVRAVFDAWHEHWQASSAIGRPIDQPAFNAALAATGLAPAELPVEYHAVIDASPRFARGAYVLHIDPREGRPPRETILGHLFDHLAATGEIDWEAVERCRCQGHPWGPPYEPWRLRQSGNHVRAAGLKVLKTLGLAGGRSQEAQLQRPAAEGNPVAVANSGKVWVEPLVDTASEKPGPPDADSPVFVIGVHRRCGSNFLGDALGLCPTLRIPRPLSEDYVLQHSPLLAEYVGRTAEEQYAKRFSDPEDFRRCKAQLLRRLGDGVLAFLSERVEPGKRLLTKTPDPFHLANFFLLFPGAALVLLVRDGRDIVESSHRSWPGEPRSHWMKTWAEGARQILDFTAGPGKPWSQRWRLVRYEDLLEGRAALEELLRFLAVDPEAFPWDALDRLPLRGSSVHRGGQKDLNWQPVDKPKDFRPVGRWESWDERTRREFKRLAGRELIELGYVEDNDW